MTTRRQILKGAAGLALLATNLAGLGLLSPRLANAGLQAQPGLPTGEPGIGCKQADRTFPRLVRHYQGEVQLPARPQRIAVLATGELDAALTLGYVPAGSTINGFPNVVPRYLLDAFAQHGAALATLVSLGKRTEPDLSALERLNADLIVGTNAGAHRLIFDQLRALAPTVLARGDGANWQQDFLFLAEVLGERKQAIDVIEHYRQRCAELRVRLATAGQSPRVSFARFGPTGLDVYGTHSFIGSIARDAGLERPVAQNFDKTLWPVQRLEELEGDWLFFSEIDYPAAQTARVQTRQAWEKLAVVRAGRAIQIDAEAWHSNAGPTAAARVLDDLEQHLGRRM